MNPYRRHPLIRIAAVLVYIFLYAPIVVLILYSFNASRANVTFEGFIPGVSERVVMDGSLVRSSPCGLFHWFCKLSKNDDVIEAAGNTLTIALTSSIIATIIGTMAALALQRYDFRLKPFSQTSLYIPIVIPEIVMGIGILTLFSVRPGTSTCHSEFDWPVPEPLATTCKLPAPECTMSPLTAEFAKLR